MFATFAAVEIVVTDTAKPRATKAAQIASQDENYVGDSRCC